MKFTKNKLKVTAAVVCAVTALAGCQEKSKKSGVQVQPQSVSPEAPPPAASTEVVIDLSKIKIEILNTDKLATHVKNESLTVHFRVSGENRSSVDMLCLAGKLPDVNQESPSLCNGTSSHYIDGLTAGESYSFSVVAYDPVTGVMGSAVSTMIDLKVLVTDPVEPGEPIPTPIDLGPQVVNVGQNWNVLVPPGMFVTGWSSSSPFTGGVMITEIKGDMNFSITGVCGSDFNPYRIDPHPTGRTLIPNSLLGDIEYCWADVNSRRDFYRVTKNMIGYNYAAIASPINAEKFTYLTVNSFEGGLFDAETGLQFEDKPSLFTNLCKGRVLAKPSAWTNFDIPRSFTVWGRQAKARYCQVEISLGILGSRPATVWVAQVLAKKASGEFDTEIVYVSEWTSAPSPGYFLQNAWELIWGYFTPNPNQYVR